MERMKKPACLKANVPILSIDKLPRRNFDDTYLLCTKIKEGGFGEVFKVMRKSDKKYLAAKFITMKSINADKALLKPYVEREISYLTYLNSNKIMKLEDQCFVSGPTHYLNEEKLVIICELAEGNLDDFIKDYDGFIPEDKIMQLFVQILLGLNYLHRNQINHRDLKPLNILLYDN